MGNGVTKSGRGFSGGGSVKAILLGSAAIYLAAGLAGDFTKPAYAQTGPRVAAQATSFNIRAQDLGGALTVFADRAGLRLLFPSSLVAGRQSPGISGSFTREEALNRLLAGTGLSYRFTNANTVTIVDPSAVGNDGTVAADGSLVLDTIDVQGRVETAWGPVDGYVAERSGTATKSDIPLIETPQTVDVVTADQVKAQNAKTVKQALRYTGGIDTEPTGLDESDQRVVIRGWSQNNGTTYLNGLQFGQSDPYFLERIEVLKGPGSVVYGNANPGGIITTTQKLPTEEPIREVFIQGGYPNRIDTGFDLGGPINDEKTILYRLTGIGFSRDSQMTEANPSQRLGVAGSVAFKPDEATNLTIWGGYEHDPNKLWYPWFGADVSVRPGVNGPIPRSVYVGNPDQNYFRTDTARIGYNFSHEFDSGLRFDSTSGYQYFDLDMMKASGNYYYDLVDDRYMNVSLSTQQQRRYSFETDNRLSYDFSTGSLEHKALAGINYRWSKLFNRAGYGTSYLFDIYDPDYSVYLPVPTDWAFQDRTVSSQLGIYAQDQIKWNNWSLLLGLRQDWYDTETLRYSDPNATPSGFSQDALTYRVGLTYLFDNGIAPYVSYATSFEPNGGTDYEGNALKPTTGEQYEAGIKYEIPGTRSLLSAAVFQITQQNLNTTDDRPGVPCCWPLQVGEVRSRGFEASIKTEITPNWNVIASYSYVDPVITRSNNGDEGLPWVAPRHRASLWTDYAFDGGPLEGLGIGGGIRFTGGYFNRDVEVDMPSVTLVDLNMSYDFGKKNKNLDGLRFDLNATNLFDKKYFLGTGTSFYYGEGRTISGKLTYKW